MVVAAHPDDETISAGGSIADAERITLVHVTDGSGLRGHAPRIGFPSRQAYARARREEVCHAFSLVPLEKDFIELGVRDQRAAFAIAAIAKSLRLLFLDRKPDLILTHAFEGTHPDHDATAMAVHLASRTLATPVRLFEMAGYTNTGGKGIYGSFLPRGDVETVSVTLRPDASKRKKAMLAEFFSQKIANQPIPLDIENFRPASQYQFTSTPYTGLPFYEQQRLGMTRRVWRILAQRAQREFEGTAQSTHLWDWLLRLMTYV